MGNKAYMRRIVDQLCLHTGDIIPDIPIGGVMPEAEFFGATGLPGTTEIAADAGHRHEMPDINDILADDAFFFDDAVATSPGNTFSIHSNGSSGGTITIGGRDDLGALGGFGTFDGRTANGATGSAGVMVQNQATAAANVAIHLWQRVRELSIRAAPGIDTGDLNQITVAVGAMTSATNFGATGAGNGCVERITDGVFFKLITDAAGAGNWFAFAINNTTTTSVDTGVPAIIDGSAVGFQLFRITYDHATTTATFFIDEVQVAQISTNIPPSTRKVAGFGVWWQNLNNGGVRQLDWMFDRLLYIGDRVAQA